MPQRDYYLGIDPGLSGGLALVDRWRHVLLLQPMPATELDLYQLLLGVHRRAGQPWACIEAVGPSIYGVGKSSCAKLYGNYCACRMAMACLAIPYDAVRPALWQRAVGVAARRKPETTTQWKNRLKGRAQQLFPKAQLTLKTCDALLLAEYCRRSQRGLL